MKKNIIPDKSKDRRYWNWIPFLVFTFSAAFLKNNKSKMLNYLGNGTVNTDMKEKTLYAYYPATDCVPTGYQFREITVESDIYHFCGFGREEGGREGFVSFYMDPAVEPAVTFKDTLPTSEVINLAVRQDYFPGFNTSGTKSNTALKEALLNFTRGDAPTLIKVENGFKTLSGKILLGDKATTTEWLEEYAPTSLLARVLGINKKTKKIDLQAIEKTEAGTVVRNILPTDW